jgi:hypothetical protein
MQRRYVLSSVALLGAASCAPRLYTPASAASFWADEPGPRKMVVLPDWSYAAAAWLLPPENPWAPYTKMTLLSSLKEMGQSPPDAASQEKSIELPDVSKLMVVSNALAAASRVAETGLPEDAAWIVDLRGPASVAFGTALSQRSALPLAVVPTFNNWPADDEMVPAEETLSAMVHMYPRRPLPEETSARPIFLLDAWRLAFRTEQVEDETYDNRYYLNSADLPDPARLQAQGIRRVIYVVESLEMVTTEEDDLHALFFAYEQAGIDVHMVDLAFLAGYSPQVTWAVSLPARRLIVVPRHTILDDPGFFLRARGGFGGPYAHPMNSRYGISHTGYSHHMYTGRGGGG